MDGMEGMHDVNEASVGSGKGSFFKPTGVKSRLAFIPFFIPAEDLEPTPELLKKASENDEVAQNLIQRKFGIKKSLEIGLAAKNPRAIKMDDGGKPGFLFGRVDSHMVHYKQGLGGFMCKKAEYERLKKPPTCCNAVADKNNLTQEAYNNYGVALIVYNTDNNGEVITLPENQAMPLDATNKLDFSYSIMRWSMNETRMREIKQHTTEFPMISSDFKIWTETQGKSERMKVAPCSGPATWMTKGPVFIKMMLKESKEIWPKVAPGLGKDLSTKDIDIMFTGSSSEEAKGNSEANYSQLLSGSS